MNVITYALAYVHGSVSLCAKHDSDDRHGALGPVQHGLHDGRCAGCALDARPLYHVSDAGQRVPLAARTADEARAEVEASSDWTETDQVRVDGPDGSFVVRISGGVTL